MKRLYAAMLAGLVALALSPALVLADPIQGQLPTSSALTGKVSTSTTVSTTSPLGGGGALSSSLTLTCTTCVTTARTVSTTSPLGGGGALSGDLALTCATCATGPGSSTANGLAKFSGTNGLALTASAGVFLDASDRLGIGTASPTHDLTLNSTKTAALYNAAIDPVNYARMAWSVSGGNFTLAEEKGGSGSAGNVTFGAGTTGGNATLSALGTSVVLNASSTAGTVTLSGSVTTGATAPIKLQNSASMSSGSLVQPIIDLAGTVNQSGTAGYKGVRLIVTETGTGSGQKDLISFETGAGVKARIDNAGTPTFASATAPPASGSAVACIYLTSSLVGFCTGSGAPTFSAAQGTLYTSTTGGAGARLYVNTSGSTTWTAATSP